MTRAEAIKDVFNSHLLSLDLFDKLTTSYIFATLVCNILFLCQLFLALVFQIEEYITGWVFFATLTVSFSIVIAAIIVSRIYVLSNKLLNIINNIINMELTDKRLYLSSRGLEETFHILNKTDLIVKEHIIESELDWVMSDHLRLFFLNEPLPNYKIKFIKTFYDAGIDCNFFLTLNKIYITKGRLYDKERIV